MSNKGQIHKKYSVEFKQKAILLYLKGELSYRAVADQMGVSDTRQIRNWVKKYRNHETLENQTGKSKTVSLNPFKGRQRIHFSNIEEERDYLKAQVEYLKKQYPNLHGEESSQK